MILTNLLDNMAEQKVLTTSQNLLNDRVCIIVGEVGCNKITNIF